MNRCETCGFLHYRTDPCRVKKSETKAMPSPATAPKPNRNKSRHRPGYFTEYMREYRKRVRSE